MSIPTNGPLSEEDQHAALTLLLRWLDSDFYGDKPDETIRQDSHEFVMRYTYRQVWSAQ